MCGALGAREDPSGIAAMGIHAIGGYRAAAGLRPKYPAITAASRGNASQGRSLFGKRIRARHSRLAEACSRSEEHTSEIQSLMRISYAVFRLNKQNHTPKTKSTIYF